VLIDNLDSVRIPIAPFKADPVPIIDANAVLPLPIAAESLKTVTRRNHEILKRPCSIHDIKLLERQTEQNRG
jgi:hypothetical protein